MTIEQREILYQQNVERLEHIAFRQIKKGMSHDAFVMVAIDMDDPEWSDVGDDLMPGENWQQYRDRGEKPIARGAAMADPLVDYISEVVPDVAPALKGPLPERVVRAIVMAYGGASVYLLEPFPHFHE